MAMNLTTNRTSVTPFRVDHRRRPTVQFRPRERFKIHAQASKYPTFIPPQISEVEEQAACDLAACYQRAPVHVSSINSTIDTAFVAPNGTTQNGDIRPPVCLLHGFDGSSLEFRRLRPMLEAQLETWAVDILGCGFSDYSPFKDDLDLSNGPEQKRDHLYAFWKDNIKRPMVLAGVSLGGAVAIDFALAYPEAVEKLVLMDAQGFIDGIGPMASMPRVLSNLGVKALQSVPLRTYAGTMAYYDPAFATDDAVRVGRLHTFLPGWQEANVAFMQSGGYSLSKNIKNISKPTLILWGRQDKILEPEFAERFESEIPNSKLIWIENCGHSCHLEKPQEVAECIFEFVGSNFESVVKDNEALTSA